MYGQINLVNFDGITAMPQEVASAWHDAVEDYVGVSYKPLLYLGWQLVNGINYYFIAEQIILSNPQVRRIVALTIHAGDNDINLIDDSIQEIL